MIKNLVFDLGNVLIEWNPDKIFRHFEADEMRRQSLREAIFDSHLWHQTDWGVLVFVGSLQISSTESRSIF